MNKRPWRGAGKGWLQSAAERRGARGRHANAPASICPHVSAVPRPSLQPTALNTPPCRSSLLPGLLEAYADLQHNSVAVPELLSAVDDQVRRGAAAEAEQEQQAAAAAAAAAAAGTPTAAPPAVDPATAAGAAASAAQPLAAVPVQRQPTQPLPGRQEALSVAGINSLLASHLRLGYAPSPLLLHSLAPQIRRQLAAGACSGAEATGLLQLLAAVQLNPGDSLVTLLLGRVVDTETQEAAAGSGSGEACGSGGGGAGLKAAAEAAAVQLLGGRAR